MAKNLFPVIIVFVILLILQNVMTERILNKLKNGFRGFPKNEKIKSNIEKCLNTNYIILMLTFILVFST